MNEPLLRLLHQYKWSEKKLKNGFNYGQTAEEMLLEAQKENLFPAVFDCEKELLTAEKEKIALIPYTSPHYPKELYNLEDPPMLLYVRGKIETLVMPSVTIIGTRQATPSALQYAFYFASIVAENDIAVVSGLARGIDTKAHEGALTKGKTCAVIGSGLLNLYPQENENLALNIAENGCVISEFPLHMAPQKYTFPKRNRILAALPKAILLIEAPEKSGAMITMRHGRSLNKKLFALPGRPGSSSAKGNHALIKEALAALVDHPNEIVNFLGIATKTENSKTKDPSFEKKEAQIIGLLKNDEYCLDDISNLLSIPIPELQATLMRLVIKKIILELPGKHYTLVIQ